MGLLKFLGVLSPAYMGLFQLTARGRFVGADQLGNKYYRGKKRVDSQRERRWVMYKDEPEASMVPPEWHGWLHYQTDAVPGEETKSFRRPWQKPHQPNLTGTSGAYRPPGHILKGGRREKATGDYEAWSPPR